MKRGEAPKEEKIYQTTLENVKGLTGRRRDGNTTRLVDNAIQIIFSGKVCVVLDHYQRGRSVVANNHLFRRILDRLSVEHNLVSLINEGKIKIDTIKLEIELVS